MIKYSIEVLLVKKINFKFTYKPLKGARKIYCKDYNTEEPQEISRGQLVPVPFNTSVTILIKYRGNYYWCPQFEECYKDYKGTKEITEITRRMFVNGAEMTLKKAYPSLTFIFKRSIFESNDIKKIKVID